MVGTDEKHIDLPDTINTVAELRPWLGETLTLDQAFSPPTVRFAIGDTIVADTASISNADTISVMPPFSGG